MIGSFTTLQIRLLLGCSDKPLSKTHLANFYRKYSIQEREQALTELIDQHLITMQEMPQKGVRKIPTFYFITEQGKQWVNQYQENYPK